MSHDPTPPERPRVEPEIIPPGRDIPPRGPVWIRMEERDGVRRVVFAQPGPGSIALALLALGAIAALALLLILGLIVVWVPIVAGLVLLAIAAAAVRRSWWRFKLWWMRRV